MTSPNLAGALQFHRQLQAALALCGEHADARNGLRGLQSVIQQYLDCVKYHAHVLPVSAYRTVTAEVVAACEVVPPTFAIARFVPVRCTALVTEGLAELERSTKNGC